jgi:ankyrin repeat protein
MNIQNADGVTALFLASRNCHSATVKELLANGAEANIQAWDGSTALIMASRNGQGGPRRSVAAHLLALINKGETCEAYPVY